MYILRYAIEGSTYLDLIIKHGLSSLITHPFSFGLSNEILKESIVLLAKALPRKPLGFKYRKASSCLNLSLQTTYKHSLFRQIASFDPIL